MHYLCILNSGMYSADIFHVNIYFPLALTSTRQFAKRVYIRSAK